MIRPVLNKRELIQERLRQVSGVAGPGLTTDEVLRLTRGRR